MFKITDTAVTPHLGTFSRASSRFSSAHAVAHEETMQAAYQHLKATAEEHGLDPGTLFLHAAGGASFVGIAAGRDGDKTFNHEYGTPDDAPNPVLRQAISAIQPQLDAHYSEVLHRELGF